MISTAKVPGVYFTSAPPLVDSSPLRTDVAGFIGRTRRGRVGIPVRVEGLRNYQREFGGLSADAVMTYAIRGYFENGGEVAHVIRLCHPKAKAAKAVWKIGDVNEDGSWSKSAPSGFEYANYRIEATSPGTWANNAGVTIRYRLVGPSGKPEVDVVVNVPGEPTEYFTGLAVKPPEDDDNSSSETFVQEINARSLLISVKEESPHPAKARQNLGPGSARWDLTLSGGRDAEEDQTPGPFEYSEAIRRLGDVSEVALVAVPGLYDDLRNFGDREEAKEILSGLIAQAEEHRDRLVLVDVPTDTEHQPENGMAIVKVDEALKWIDELRELTESTDNRSTRAAAVYHPRLNVPDPLGGLIRPLRSVPPSGHVAGVISRLDRQRGAHHTPANAEIFEAVDITQQFDPREQEQLNTSGVNLLRCSAGNGLQVWGGRTLNLEPQLRFLVYRRLIHRLVRAIRRVAEPLVFDINGPEMWLAITRSITAVLLEAWRAGALKGVRQEEAFRVRCDEELNPPSEQELGRVYCEIDVAPATPMEFIHLRLSLSGEGRLEVFES